MPTALPDGLPAVVLRVLGPLELTADSEPGAVHPGTLGGPKQQLVLGAMGIRRVGRVCSVPWLIDAVWNEDAPSRPEATLQVYVSNLRRVLQSSGVSIETATGGYRLVVADSMTTDLEAMSMLAVRAADTNLTVNEQFVALTRAVGLVRGTPLEGLSLGLTLGSEVTAVQNTITRLYEQRFETMLCLGRHHGAVDELRAAISADPLNEKLRSQLVLALYRCNRQADALRVVADTRELLADIGIELSPLLRDLESAVLRQLPRLDFRPADDEGTETVMGTRAFLHATLVVNGAEVPVGRSQFLIGRQADCDLVITDPEISRRHATLRAAGNRHEIEDHNSANGTFVNGEPVTRALLKSGDLIRFGGTVEVLYQTAAANRPD